MDKVDVRIYSGTSRTTSFEPLVSFNEQPVPGEEYRVKAKGGGILVVAIPEEDANTSLEFSYQLSPHLPKSQKNENT